MVYVNMCMCLGWRCECMDVCRGALIHTVEMDSRVSCSIPLYLIPLSQGLSQPCGWPGHSSASAAILSLRANARLQTRTTYSWDALVH